MSTGTKAYIGTWHNYNNGEWTLTLRQREGGILSAALVIFVGFAATQGWNIVKFALHQARLGPTQDGLHQQLQAMLRNSTTHAQAAWYAVRIPAGWRRQNGFSSALARASPILIASLVSILAWAAVQVSLSRIWTDAGNEFLVDSELCNWVDTSEDFESVADAEPFGIYIARTIEAASAYVSLCYENSGTGAVDENSCQRLPRSRINWTMSDASCPFADSSLCISTNSTPVMLDTGYLSSSADFGVNTRREESILYRMRTTCSPVSTKYQGSPAEGLTYFYYGTEGFTYAYHDQPIYLDDLKALAYGVE